MSYPFFLSVVILLVGPVFCTAAADSPSQSSLLEDDTSMHEFEQELTMNGTTTATQTLRAPGLSTNPNLVNFFLYYDRHHLEFRDKLEVYDVRSVRGSHFVPNQPVIFLIHGYFNRFDDDKMFAQNIKNSYLRAGYVNIIVTDWQELAATGSNLLVAAISYLDVEQSGATKTGEKLCEMIRFLVRAKFITGPEQVHLIGHSLGAHVSGVAGRCVKQKVKRPVDRITGLDPAIYFGATFRPQYGLDGTDATFVDMVHTDLGGMGSYFAPSTVNFFANGGWGWKQPKCINATLNPVDFVENAVIGYCSHARAFHYWARSILRITPELVGCRCLGANIFVLPVPCISPINACHGQVLFGQNVPRTAYGKYYVRVDPDLPNLSPG